MIAYLYLIAMLPARHATQCVIDRIEDRIAIVECPGAPMAEMPSRHGWHEGQQVRRPAGGGL